jgi:hypothetical protein
MTTDQFEKRKERLERETFIISKTEGGFRVYSPAHPGMSYQVSGTSEALACTCPDFEYHKSDPGWRCKHILAVKTQWEKANGTPPKENGQEPNKTQPLLPKQASVPPTNPGSSQMLIKRSVSPDGRIDSLSVEFACSIEKMPGRKIVARAENALQIQSEIVERFLKGKPKQKNQETAKEEPAKANDASGPVLAKMLMIGGMNSRWGRRLFINMDVNGKNAKLFGSRKQLADYLIAAGFPYLAPHIGEGMKLDLSCRVITKPSKDGKYLDIEKVMPIEKASTSGRAK